MSPAPPWLGKAEDERLEFKSAQALRRRESIVRAVVALLNRAGGHVIVGVNDLGVPEGRESLKSEVEALQSALLDTIEPRPLEQIAVRAEAIPSGGEVLNVTVKRKRSSTSIFAERRNGMYGFWIRSGATTRALTLAEIGERLQRIDSSAPQWKRWDEPLIARKAAAVVLVLQAELVDALDIDALKRVLLPERQKAWAGREMGWTVTGEGERFKRVGRKLESGSVGARKWLSCDPGAKLIRFEGTSDFLKWRAPAGMTEPVIYPFPVTEGVASFFWLLRAYAAEAHPEESVFVQLGIWRPGGYRLGPHRHDSLAWQHPTRWAPPHDNTSVEKSLEISWDELRHDDGIARAFAAHVYEDFGYDEDAIPFWNTAQRRFEFPR